MPEHENARNSSGEGCEEQAGLLQSEYDGGDHSRAGAFLL